MNIKQIQALAEIIEKTGLTALEITEDGTNIRLERNAQVMQMPVASSPATQIVNVQEVQNEQAPAEKSEEKISDTNLTEIKSPMVGVYYAAPSPESEPFVKVGDKVKKGDVICIIEAMKLMNELTAEYDGEIVEINAENGQLVEFGQCLFKLK